VFLDIINIFVLPFLSY